MNRKQGALFFKRTMLALLLLLISFSMYVVIVNRNSKQMTIRQKILKAVYPAFMWMTRKSPRVANISSNNNATPVTSFYSLKDSMTNGKEFDFSQLKGKKVLLVNTASDCGYTGQYDELEKLYGAYKDKLVVIGFPANDFKDQEKGTDDEIAAFCKLNFGVSFPLMKKSTVLKKEGQNVIFKWLTDSTQNGWNDRQPVWNFSKYLVNEEGKLIRYFAPSVSPLDKSVTDAVTDK